MSTVNVSKMFSEIEPWDVSNSEANLGENASKLTWDNALKIADDYKSWLVSNLGDACDQVREYAENLGAWDEDEIASWTDKDCLAFLVQYIASELRTCLDVDNSTIEESCALYESTDWAKESEYPRCTYYLENGEVFADFSEY